MSDKSKNKNKTDQPKKLFDDQLDDEDVKYVFRKHPIVMRKGLVIGAFAPLLCVLPATVNLNLGLGWFFGGLGIGLILWGVILFPFWIAWYYSIMILTDQRLIQITQKGLFHKTVVDLGLSQIQMVNYQIGGLQQTLLGYGTIMMQTYVGDLIIHDIHHPATVQKKVLNVLREQGIVTKSMPINEE